MSQFDHIKDRNMMPFEDYILVIDDSGGMDILDYTDKEAVYLFLKWLEDERNKRERIQARVHRALEANKRRKAFAVVKKY